MQLKCCGLAAYVRLMEQGYPERLEYKNLLATYGLSPICQRFKQVQVEVLLQSIGLGLTDFKVGHTRVCLRALKKPILQKILHPDVDEIFQVKKTYDSKLKIFQRWSTIVSNLLERHFQLESSEPVL